MIDFDLSNTLLELEGKDIGEVNFCSHLVTTCHKLYTKPLKDFTTEDLRIMIGQGFGLKYLVPIALEHLSENPFAEGDYYLGDLLEKVLKVEQEFWIEHPNLHYELDGIIIEVKSTYDTLMLLINQYKHPYEL